MKSDARASLDDLAIRWETPRGREIKAEIMQDVRHNKGERLPEILKDFIYVAEVPDGRDLRCITLEDMDLADTVWKGCDLSWASFARSTLTRADFRETNLKRANMADSNLSLGRFAEADAARADFSRANLEHANFKEAKLNGAVFVDAKCSRCSFDTANLAKCNFVGADLEQANFSNADCNNGNFSGSGLDAVAAKPTKAWGIVYDMALDEFERKVGLNSLTARTTKKFKGLDVLLKASAALAKVAKKPGPLQPMEENTALGAAPGQKRLDTFKRPEDGSVFGAGLRKKTEETAAAQAPSDVASTSDYLEEAGASFDPDDPDGDKYEDVGSADTTGIVDEAVGAFWTDGRGSDDSVVEAEPTTMDPSAAADLSAYEQSGAPAEAPPEPRAPEPRPERALEPPRTGGPRPRPQTGAQPSPPPAAPRPVTRPQPGPRPGATGEHRAGAPTVAAPGGSAPSGEHKLPTGEQKLPTGAPRPPRPTAPVRAPEGSSTSIPLPPRPTTGRPAAAGPRAAAPGSPAPATGAAPGAPGPRATRPLGPAGAPPPGAPPPGTPRAAATTKPLGRPSPQTGPVPTAPQPAPAPSFVSPLDPGAPDAVTDWAKAIGQLMQMKASITKIVVETGDKSRIIFKKAPPPA